MKTKTIITALIFMLILTGCGVEDTPPETESESNNTETVVPDNNNMSDIVDEETVSDIVDSEIITDTVDAEDTAAAEVIDYKSIYADYLSSLIEKGETEDVSFSLVDFEDEEIPYLVLESTFEKDYTKSGYSYNDYYTIDDGVVLRKFTTGGSRYLLYDSVKNTFFTPIDTVYGTSGYADRLYGYRFDDMTKFAERPELDGFAVSLESGIHDYFVRYEYRVDSYYEETEPLKTYFDYYKIDEDDTVSAEAFFGRMYEDMSDCTRAVFYEVSEENISSVFEGNFEVTADAYEVLEDFWSEKTDFLTYFCG